MSGVFEQILKAIEEDRDEARQVEGAGPQFQAIETAKRGAGPAAQSVLDAIDAAHPVPAASDAQAAFARSRRREWLLRAAGEAEGMRTNPRFTLEQREVMWAAANQAASEVIGNHAKAWIAKTVGPVYMQRARELTKAALAS